MAGYDSIDGPEQTPLDRGLGLFQAAVVTGCIGQITTAYGFLDNLLHQVTDHDARRKIATVAVSYVCRTAVHGGADWTTRGREATSSIEDRSPAPRVSTLRLLAAWSSTGADGDDNAPDDPDAFNALLNVALERYEFLRDLFEFAVDHAEFMSVRSGKPRTMLWQYAIAAQRTLFPNSAST